MSTTAYEDETRDLPDEAAAADEEAQIEARGFTLRSSILRPRTLISFGLALAIILFIFRGVDINPAETLRQMRQVNPGVYLLAFGVFYSTFVLRALRWRVLLRNAGFELPAGRGSWASLPALTTYLGLSWFVNCIVPAKLGDAYRGYLLKHNGNVSFSRTFGTVFAERLLDMIVLFGLLVLSGWYVFGAHLPPATRYIFILGLMLVFAIIVGLAAMRYLSPFIRRVVPGRFEQFYGHFEEGTLGSLRPSAMPLLVVLTSLIWVAESLRLFFVIQAMGGFHLALPSIVFVALTSSLLTTIPATPGGLGIVEGGIIGVLISPLFGVAKVTATAAAFLDRLINFWSIVVFGLILFLVSKRK